MRRTERRVGMTISEIEPRLSASLSGSSAPSRNAGAEGSASCCLEPGSRLAVRASAPRPTRARCLDRLLRLLRRCLACPRTGADLALVDELLTGRPHDRDARGRASAMTWSAPVA